MELLFNVILLIFLAGYGVIGETQLSLKRLCGLSGSANVYKSLDLSAYAGEIRDLRKSLDIEFTGPNGDHQQTLKHIKAVNQPFTLVLFDSHFDSKPAYKKIHCGNWVNYTFGDNPLLNRVIGVGISKAIKFEMASSWCNYELLKTGKYIVFPALRFQSYFKDTAVPDVISSYSESCEFDNMGRFLGSPGYCVRWSTPSYSGIKSFIEPGRYVYISIDLDVFKNVRTPYGSGKIDAAAACEIIRAIGKDYKIAGVDICGTDDISSKPVFEEILKCLRKI